MARLRAEGLTLAEIGRRLGVSRQRVKVALDNVGLGRRPPLRCHQCKAVILTHSPTQLPPLSVYCLPCLNRHPKARFGDRLRAFRYAAGLTQEQLAAKAGLPKATLHRHESGAVERLPWPTMVALARVLGAGLLTRGLGLPGAGVAAPDFNDNRRP
jgi:transcriptional regulator with XRE-family HTH domain